MPNRYTVIPTADEWRRGLMKTQTRRTSRAADIAKTVILLLLCLYCWIPFFWDGGRAWDSFAVGLLALLLLAALWIVPPLALKREAAKIAKSGQTVRLTVTEIGLGFGEGDRYRELPFSAIGASADPDLLTLTFDGGAMLVLPRRCVEPDWDYLCEQLTAGR